MQAWLASDELPILKFEMPRLTATHIADLELRLAQWQTPEAMSRLVDDTMERMGSQHLFKQPGLAFLRDAWIAAEFGAIRQAEQVRLVADNWPDFELEIERKVEAFEAVETDDPKRLRGDEYSDDSREIEDDPVEDWISRAEQAPAWLEAACQKKINKRYGARANLVIYLNLNEHGVRQQEVEQCFLAATAPAKDSFETVWVLWKDRAYLIWLGDQPHCPVAAPTAR
jgi:hypothetical protein